VLLDRMAKGDSLSGVRGVEDVFKLSEVRGGFEAQGIRIEAMAIGVIPSGLRLKVISIRPSLILKDIFGGRRGGVSSTGGNSINSTSAGRSEKTRP
jgi:hypothetical protein